MEAGGGRCEDVLRGEVRMGGNEGEEGGDEEDGEGLGDGLGDWLYKDRRSDCLDLLGAIPGYELGDEERPQCEEEGFETVGMSVEAGLVGAIWRIQT